MATLVSASFFDQKMATLGCFVIFDQKMAPWADLHILDKSGEKYRPPKFSPSPGRVSYRVCLCGLAQGSADSPSRHTCHFLNSMCKNWQGGPKLVKNWQGGLGLAALVGLAQGLGAEAGLAGLGLAGLGLVAMGAAPGWVPRVWPVRPVFVVAGPTSFPAPFLGNPRKKSGTLF